MQGVRGYAWELGDMQEIRGYAEELGDMQGS